MLPTLVRRLAQTTTRMQLPPREIPAVYKLKKVWPPDMSTMSAQQQLRFEKKYKRRLKLATARPGWDKGVKLAQLFTITFVLVYTALFMDWKEMPNPYGGIREKFWSFFGVFTEEARAIEPKQHPKNSGR
ncbi:hypothetical protein QBC42DRAFT_294910 [Cladorrhinum samala]|uniref:Uncharacterized protein n=1 Tax=Cladorrhinum samala TaxID=585594 RepID=A0AAV9HYN7_9PEZI|nr:hypothetical protein QBC42DRAFT_294910 [Cladorrhinum samala]